MNEKQCDQCGVTHVVDFKPNQDIRKITCGCGATVKIKNPNAEPERQRPVFLVKAKMLSGNFYEDMQPAVNTMDAYYKWLENRNQLSVDQIYNIEIKLFEL